MPGTIGLSTSAITAIRISVALTPISVAVGFSVVAEPAEPVDADTGAAITMAATTMPTTTAARRRADQFRVQTDIWSP